MARIISVFPDLHAIVLDALVDNSDKNRNRFSFPGKAWRPARRSWKNW